MISTGFTLAALTSVGLYMVYRKLPRGLRAFMERHVLLTDLVAMLLTYAFLGGTLVALCASAFLGIITSIMLALANNPRSAALMERCAVRLGQIKDDLVNWIISMTPEENVAKDHIKT